MDRTFGQLLVGDVLQGGFALSSGLLAGDWVVTVTAVSSGDRGFTLSKSLSFSLPEVLEELDPPENNPVTRFVEITGTVTQNETLGFNTSNLRDRDGDVTVTGQQWLRNGEVIAGATG